MQTSIIFQDLGLIDYQQAWDLQETVFQNTIQLKLENQNRLQHEKEQEPYRLFFCEHPHVYTLGKSGESQNLLIDGIQLQAKNASFVRTNRGGDITYHGPGQLVGYPIIDLEAFKLGVKNYIELMEESIIRTIAHFGLKGERLDGATGVWLDTTIAGKTRKICAIGVRTSRYVSMHGFAFNVNTDLNYFGYINPCGFTDKGVSSLQKELGQKQDIEEVKTILLNEMATLFGWKYITI
jgi:lipoyl(octanoyl) transferase